MVLERTKESRKKSALGDLIRKKSVLRDLSTNNAKICRMLLIACQNGNIEILKLLVDDLEKDDRTDWSTITEYLFIRECALMNSISSRGFNKFSPYHEMSNYLRELAQKHGKIQFLLLRFYFFKKNNNRFLI